MSRLRLRLIASLGSVVMFTATVSAQVTPGPLTVAAPGSSSYNPAVPPAGEFFNNGIPGNAFLPGSGFVLGNTISFSGPRGTAVPFNYGGYSSVYGVNGVYSGYGLPYGAYGMYPYAASFSPYYLPYSTPIGLDIAPPPPLPTTGVGPVTMVQLQGLPATLSMEFPAAAYVWVNGKKMEGSAATKRDIASPALKPGDPYTFDVKAEWSADGKTYEYDRTVKLSAGERSKVTVVAGTPKK